MLIKIHAQLIKCVTEGIVND